MCSSCKTCFHTKIVLKDETIVLPNTIDIPTTIKAIG